MKIIAYCLLPNHYHLILHQLQDKGISNYLHKVGVSYSKYFNKKYNRSGVLFQGKYKAKHIDSDEYLIWLSAYININAEIHKIKPTDKHRWSSYSDYISDRPGLVLVNTEMIMSNFSSGKDYQNYLNKIIPV